MNRVVPDRDVPLVPIARHVWEQRYRQGGAGEASVQATWRRVARALAAVEPADQAGWQARFAAALQDFAFLPGGRILAGAGTHHRVSLFNCFVMGTIKDSLPGIFRALEEGAVTMQQGGGAGYDFSTLRPHGARAMSAGTVASGPVSFMDVWDAMCATIQSTGARRGAMMATLRCDHPDIGGFIDAKRQPGRLRHFTLSVQVTDAFMQAVADDASWDLVFPAAALRDEHGTVALETTMREWPGAGGPVACRVLRRLPARALWERLLRASFATGEPGVLFIDRINRMNNLGYCERISATNPCGEVPLPPYGACDLGAINLARLVRDPFGPHARLDLTRAAALAAVAVRLLDNVIDASIFPLPQQRDAVRRARRVGLGVTGLGDALAMLGLRYDAPAAREAAAAAMRTICHAAYRASIAIAAEKGSFPGFAREAYLAAPFIRALPDDIRDGIARQGIRNSHLLAIAPTGTISLLAGNLSSGIEPVFAADAVRTVLDAGGAPRRFRVTDAAVALWRAAARREDGAPPALTTAAEVSAENHLAMQAALQPCVDNAISKTINLPAGADFAAFAAVFRRADTLGLKGCTVFRPAAGREAVLTAAQGQAG
ncbi:MAG: adenosylcobalamin-dependent ribonucleoside-diphosphate reductase [Rhodospirillales bacterium]|nr:adenosylcobalamin-dependent ribonucleoside-diphosphate reductase [Rhodospirillales bacterium]